MAQMRGFERVLVGYPQDVQHALARIQSPAAYFSSCSLEVFKRHEKFGKFGESPMPGILVLTEIRRP